MNTLIIMMIPMMMTKMMNLMTMMMPLMTMMMTMMMTIIAAFIMDGWIMYQSSKTNLPCIAIRLMDCLDSIQCEYIFTQPLAVIFAPLQIYEECKKYILQI